MLEALDPHDVTPPPAIGELAQACGVLAMEGHLNRTLGHVSLRDPQGRGFWVKRSGISLAETASPADFVLLDLDGELLSGLPFGPLEWPMHACIYRARPDINVVAHTHPFYAGIMAGTDAPIEGLTREGSLLRRQVRRFEFAGSFVANQTVGADLAEALGDGAAVILRNSGVVFCGRSIGACVLTGVMLEVACRAQTLAGTLSHSPNQSDRRQQHQSPDGILSEPEMARRWAYYRRRLVAQERRLGERGGSHKTLHQPIPARTTRRDAALAELAVAHRILAMEGHSSNTMGAISLRDSGGEGYWTKIAGIGMDEVFSPAEMILVGFDGSRIAGGANIPSNWPLRSAILQARPDINAVVYSRAFHAVVFSATDQPYLAVGDDAQQFGGNLPVLADVSGPVRDFDTAAKVAARLDKAGGLLIKNTGMIAVGESLTVATLRAIALNRAAHAQFIAQAGGHHWLRIGEAGRLRPTDPEALEAFWRYFCRKLERYEAARPLPGE